MTAAISNSMIQWCHTTILEPPNEGVARINRCFRGVNLHHIDYPKLNWSKRIIDLLTGIALLIPLLNTVVWIFMRTFGNAETLSQPISPHSFEPWREAIQASDPILGEVPALAPMEGEVPLHTYTFKCADKTEEYSEEHEAVWEIKSYAGSHVTTRNTRFEYSKGTYTTEWELDSLEYKSEAKQLEFKATRSQNIITIIGTEKKKKFNLSLTLEESRLPWIQQSMGFHPFAKSIENRIDFYSIDFKKRSVKKFYAEVKERGQLMGYGPLVKFDIKYPTLLKDLTIGTCWFNPHTGRQYKNEYDCNPFYDIWGKSKLKQPL